MSVAHRTHPASAVSSEHEGIDLLADSAEASTKAMDKLGLQVEVLEAGLARAGRDAGRHGP